jgi:two-component system, NtrC family, nitrogen regulation sensor histidine kinase NtrY
MKLAHRLLVYLLALHLLFFAFSWVLFVDTPALFLVVEVLLLVSFFGGLWLVRRALQPLGYTRRFHELLQDQHYAARLEPSDDPELQELLRLFNRMLDTLHQERLLAGEQQGFFAPLLEATPVAVLVFDFEGRVSLRNAAALALLGHTQPNEASPDPRAQLWPQLQAVPLGERRMLHHSTDGPHQGPNPSHHHGRRLRASRGQFFDRGFARHFLLVEELTQELERSERSTYERLVRVLAHEVNNTVAATGSVLGSLGHYAEQLRDGDRHDFTSAVHAVRQRNASLAAFIERFTHVVKMPEPQLQRVQLATLIDHTARLFRERCQTAGIELLWTQPEGNSPVRLDPLLMEQALLNIVKNAIEATETSLAEQAPPPHPHPGGRIELALLREPGPTGPRLCLRVTDSGNRLHELPPEALFTPFVSTKRGGQGIGLMFVREVLQRHGFAYRLAPTGSGQTRFEVWMPEDPPPPETVIG